MTPPSLEDIKLAVIGLGYVGLFVGLDVNQNSLFRG